MSSGNEKELEEKKNLLQTEILDKNYDQLKFVEFCLSKKPNGDDLTIWSLEELKLTIQEFISKNPKPNPQDQMQNLNINNINNNVNNYNDFQKDIEMNWLVKRRYSDFVWLRQVLSKFNPGHLVPPLPDKQIGPRRFELDFIAKRMKFLQKFIDDLLENEIFKASEPLKAFLSMTDKNQFAAKMKELASYLPSPYVSEFRTFDGEVEIDRPDEGDKEKYFVNITHYFRIQSQLFERLNSNFKELNKNLTNSCYALNDIQRDFQTLHLLNVRVAMKDEITKSFEELGKFFKNWKRITYKQNEIFKTYLKDFFKFMGMECEAYNELIVKRNNLKNNFFEEQKKLNTKKEKLWATGDASKWEIIDDFNNIDRMKLMSDKMYAFSKMCTQDTNHMINLGNTLGFYNKRNMQELKKLMKNNCNKYMKDLKDFTDNFYPTLTDALTVYTSIQMFVNSYKEK